MTCRSRFFHCGACHSDIHMARNEWKQSIYPIVPGHEIDRKSQRRWEQGHEIQKRGDVAGVGVMVDSCRCASTAGRVSSSIVKSEWWERTARATRTATSPRRVLEADRRGRELRAPHPPTSCRSPLWRPFFAPASPPTRRCATGKSARVTSWAWSDSVDWATWR